MTTIEKKLASARLAVAPMMDWTDRHCRVLHRLLAPRALLFTEMVPAGAVVHAEDRARFLGHDPIERPLVLQLGGSEPALLGRACAIAADWGYDAIDLNCGCPSPRVKKGGFGVALMTEPELVGRCVASMVASSSVPITVKHRLGVDDEEGVDFAAAFVARAADAGARRFVVHARKAWLDGLSPKENREIPPLRYDWAAELAARFPALPFVLNGGIKEPERAAALADGFAGVMIGREAYQNPGSLPAFEQALFGAAQGLDPRAALERYADYAENALARGFSLGDLARPALGLFRGEKGARAFRRILSEGCRAPGAGARLFEEASAALA